MQRSPRLGGDRRGVLLQQAQRSGVDGAKAGDSDVKGFAQEATFRTCPPWLTPPWLTPPWLTPRDLRNALMLRTAWRVRCSFSTRPRRTKPSPYSPKPMPEIGRAHV